MNYKKYTGFNILIAIIFLVVAGFIYSRNGVLDTVSVSILIVASVLILFWMAFNMDILKQTVKSRGVKFSTNAVVFAFAVFCILAAINYIVTDNNKFYDSSEGKIYSFSDQTIKVLKNLKKEVTVYGFFVPEDLENKMAFEKTMERYSYYTKKLSYEAKDPYKEPVFTKKYNITESGLIVVKVGNFEKKIKSYEESEFLNAVKEVLADKKKKIYFVKGHGEKSILNKESNGYSTLTDRLQKDNFTVEELELIRFETIPEDASSVIIASPEKEYLESEMKTLENYADRGGKLVFLIDPFKNIFSSFLQRFGVRPLNSVIIDVNPVAQLLGTNYVMPIVSEYGNHKITENFDLTTVYNMALPLTREEGSEYKVNVLCKTGASSWAETDNSSLESGKVKFEDDDIKGPVNVAVIAEKNITKGTEEIKLYSEKTKVLIIGDSEFPTNDFIDLQGNGDFILNSINYLSGNDDLIAIRPKEKKSQLLQITQGDANAMFYIYYIVIPFFPLAIYLIFYFYKRRSLNAD